jgi:hypothetical protein
MKARMSATGLGCIKTRRRGNLIEQISLRIAIGAMAISELGRFEQSENDILLVLKLGKSSHSQCQAPTSCR